MRYPCSTIRCILFEGGNEKVPLPSIETEELEIVGKIIIHL